MMRPLFTDALVRPADAARLARPLRALAEPARLRMLNALHARGAMYGQELAGAVGLTQPTVFHHLQVLREAGLVERCDPPSIGGQGRGGRVYHRLAPGRVAAVVAALDPDRRAET